MERLYSLMLQRLSAGPAAARYSHLVLPQQPAP
jgi:hypothetical protein